MRFLPLIGLLLLFLAPKAVAQDLLQVDFSGTDPALNAPWTQTSTLDPNLLFSGIDFGSGAFPESGYDHVFGFHVRAYNGISTLSEAISDNQYLTFSLAPISGTMNLGGKKIVLGVERLGFWSPTRYSLFTSIDGFSEAQALFSSPSLDRNNRPEDTFEFILPLQGFDNLTTSVEFRLVMHEAQYSHPTTLTSVGVIDIGPVFTLDLSEIGQGSVSTIPDGDLFEVGTAVQLVASPDAGHAFSGWTGDVTGLGNPRTITMDQDLLISGGFEANSTPSMELGMNLNYVRDWSTGRTFLDIVTSARPWLTRPTTNSSVWDSGFRDEMPVDANGWPLEIPFTASDGLEHFAHTLVGLPLPGDYTVIAEGSGRLELFSGGSRQTFLFGGGTTTHTFSVAVGDAGGNAFFEIEESLAADPLVNIRVIQPGHETTYQANPFDDSFLERLEPFTSARFMDWGATNHSPVMSWGDRTTRTTYSQALPGGVALEYVSEFTAHSGMDPWICIPHMADDNYIRQTARFLRDQIPVDKKIYVEYSNETWNTIFAQTYYVQDMGEALGLSTNRWQAGQFYCGVRSAEIWDIFAEEFVDDTRFVKVLATHTANSNTTNSRFQALNNPAWNPNYTMPDALAIAPYFGKNFFPSEIPPLAPSYPSVDELLDVYAVNSLAEQVVHVSEQKVLADAQGAALICYEGGQHFTGLFEAQNDQTLTDLMHTANRDPRMGALYLEYLDMLQAGGVSLFANFTYVGAWSRYGSFGVLEYQDQPTASATKYQALLDWMVPQLSVANLSAGQDAEMHIQRGTPGGSVVWAYSMTGAGPTPTLFGDLLLSAPIHRVATGTIGNDGKAIATRHIPAGSAGASVWFHALDLSSHTFSNGVSMTIQ